MSFYLESHLKSIISVQAEYYSTISDIIYYADISGQNKITVIVHLAFSRLLRQACLTAGKFLPLPAVGT